MIIVNEKSEEGLKRVVGLENSDVVNFDFDMQKGFSLKDVIDKFDKTNDLDFGVIKNCKFENNKYEFDVLSKNSTEDKVNCHICLEEVGPYNTLKGVVDSFNFEDDTFVKPEKVFNFSKDLFESFGVDEPDVFGCNFNDFSFCFLEDEMDVRNMLALYGAKNSKDFYPECHTGFSLESRFDSGLSDFFGSSTNEYPRFYLHIDGKELGGFEVPNNKDGTYSIETDEDMGKFGDFLNKEFLKNHNLLSKLRENFSLSVYDKNYNDLVYKPVDEFMEKSYYKFLKRSKSSDEKESNAFSKLSSKQKVLVTAIQKWAKENDIRNDKGYLLSFNSNTKNPQAAFNALLKQAKEKGFVMQQENNKDKER